MPYPQFHFLMLAAGEILKEKSHRRKIMQEDLTFLDVSVTPSEIQTMVYQDEAFGVKPPLEDCELSLSLLEDAGFLKRYTSDKWIKNED